MRQIISSASQFFCALVLRDNDGYARLKPQKKFWFQQAGGSFIELLMAQALFALFFLGATHALQLHKRLTAHMNWYACVLCASSYWDALGRSNSQYPPQDELILQWQKELSQTCPSTQVHISETKESWQFNFQGPNKWHWVLKRAKVFHSANG